MLPQNLSYKHIKLFLDAFSDGILILDRQHNIVFANLAFYDIFSIDRDILGQKFEKLLEFDTTKKLFFLFGSNFLEYQRKELEVHEKLFLQVSSKILEYEKNFLFIISIHDITKIKMVDRLKTRFVSVSAHQLRTPLSALKWTFEYLLKEKAGKLNEFQYQLIEKAFQSVNQMVSIVNHLLQVSRAEEEKLKLNLKKEDLSKVIFSVVSLLEEEIKRKEIKLSIKLPENSLPKFKFDSEYLGLAIQTLLDNAIRYNRERGEVELAVEKIDGKVMVKVRDTGIGIPEKEKEHIFSEFYRASNAQKLVPSGSGIGLFLARSIIKAHQGEIWFESKEGKGSIFYFTLPIL
jgi:two-component system phosphate regulon sensor histidine kinase PhoR